MLQYLFAVAVFCFALEPVCADSSYVYHYDEAQFIAGMLKMAEANAERRPGSFFGEFQRQFIANGQSYIMTLQRAQMSQNCSTSDDYTNLQKYRATFEASIQICRNQTECNNNVGEAIERTILVVQQIDTTGYNQQLACADDACKLKVSQDTQNQLWNIYRDAMSFIRPTIEQSINNPQCTAAVNQCLESLNKDNLTEMNKRILDMQACIATSYVYPFPDPYGSGPYGPGGYSGNSPYGSYGNGQTGNGRHGKGRHGHGRRSDDFDE